MYIGVDIWTGLWSCLTSDFLVYNRRNAAGPPSLNLIQIADKTGFPFSLIKVFDFLENTREFKARMD